MSAALHWIVLLVAASASAGLLINRNWRWGLGLLAGQYLAIFLLVLALWPVSLAAVKLVAGWMACTVLGIAQLTTRQEEEGETHWPQNTAFQVFTAALVLAVSYSISTRASAWLGIDLPTTWAGLTLVGMGLLHLGLTKVAFRVVIALLTILGGFEVLYAAVENSALVAALLVVVNLGLALAGAYFLTWAEEPD